MVRSKAVFGENGPNKTLIFHKTDMVKEGPHSLDERRKRMPQKAKNCSEVLHEGLA